MEAFQTLDPGLEDFQTIDPGLEDFQTLDPGLEDFQTLDPGLEDLQFNRGYPCPKMHHDKMITKIESLLPGT